MKIIATCMASNEFDIIEAFVRHNAPLLDALVVLDHASLDATPEILASLAREGLPLVVLQDPDFAYRQSQRQSWLAKRYLAQLQADFCFVLDADEFIRCESRAKMEAALSSLPAGTCGLVPLQNYLGLGAGAAEANPVRRLTRRMRSEREAMRKVVVPREVGAEEAALVTMGNHAAVRVDASGRPQPYPHRPLEGLSLAHFPVRSSEQIAKKVLVGWLSHRLTQPERYGVSVDDPRAPASHWRRLFLDLAAGKSPADPSLFEQGVAASAGGGSPVRDDELVEDPLPAPYELRYTPAAAHQPLALLAKWTERLIQSVNAGTLPRG